MKIAVGMSGGVDSSVTAALLLEQGHEVEGVFMKNWSPESIQALTDCPWEQDQADAAAVCSHLGIPFRSVNFEKEYRERVVDYFLREYSAGRTPNPDVMCNSEIKFKAFQGYVKELGADAMATGHYARRVETKGRSYIGRGVHSAKDQSYFLWELTQEQISNSFFPVGEMEKSKVRERAREFGLPTATKKDSQGICFIGHIDVKQFLRDSIAAQPGDTWLLPFNEGQSFSERIEKAVKVGSHSGVMYYTIGERAGEIIDNGVYRKARFGADVRPVYVIHKDMQGQRLYVTDDRNDPHLSTSEFIIEDARELAYVSDSKLMFQTRYQQKPIEVAAYEQSDGRAFIRSAEPIWGVASGQSLVVYQDNLVIGGGIIQATELTKDGS